MLLLHDPHSFNFEWWNLILFAAGYADFKFQQLWHIFIVFIDGKHSYSDQPAWSDTDDSGVSGASPCSCSYLHDLNRISDRIFDNSSGLWNGVFSSTNSNQSPIFAVDNVLQDRRRSIDQPFSTDESLHYRCTNPIIININHHSRRSLQDILCQCPMQECISDWKWTNRENTFFLRKNSFFSIKDFFFLLLSSEKTTKNLYRLPKIMSFSENEQKDLCNSNNTI